MGAGYHGGFGNTAGENKHKNNVDTIKKSKCKYLANFGTIDSNAKAMSSIYPMKNGYFGVKGKNHRVIYSKDQYRTASDFYLRISHGGSEKSLPNNKGKISYLEDGTKIVYRPKTSTPDSPAVEITIYYPNSVRGQKIHFLKED